MIALCDISGRFRYISSVFKITVIVFIAIAAKGVNASDCIWLGGTGNWIDSNWSACSGGFPESDDAASISSGVVTLNQALSVRGFDLLGGELTGSGTLSVSGLMNWAGGSSAIAGSGSLRAAGGLAMQGDVMSIQDSYTLVNGVNQNANWLSGTLQLRDADSTLRNEGVFNIRGDSRDVQGAGLFENNGHWNLNLNDRLQQLNFEQTILVNNGHINIQQGELLLGRSAVHNGVFSTGAGGLINFTQNLHTLEGGSSIIAENVRFGRPHTGFNTVAIVNGDYDVVNTEIIGNTTAIFNNQAYTEILVLGSDNGISSVLSGTGTFTVSGQMLWTGDQFSSSMNGTGITRAEGGLILNGRFMNIFEGRILVNGSGQIALWESGILGIGMDSVLRNEESSIFNITGNSRSLTGTGLFDNLGSLIVNLDNHMQEIAFVDFIGLNNHHSVLVQRGNLRLGGGGDHSGVFSIASDSVLEFSGGIHNLSADSGITANTVWFTDQDVIGLDQLTNINGRYDVVNTAIDGGTVNFNNSIQTGSLVLDGGGRLGGSGEFIVDGHIHWIEGIMGGAGITRANGGLTIDRFFSWVTDDRTLINSAGQTANWSSINLNLVNNGSVFRNEAGAVFNAAGSNQFLVGNGLFDNQGDFFVNLSDSNRALQARTNLNNDGLITINNGTLSLQRGIISGHGEWFANGGSLFISDDVEAELSGDVHLLNSGGLELDANAELSLSSLNMDATASLEAGRNSVLSISGDLSFAMTNEQQWLLSADSTLEMLGGVGAEIGSWDEWSVLEVGGEDIGRDPHNHIGALSGFENNFEIPELLIAADAHIFLADLLNNGNRNGAYGGAEALYIGTLIFADASGLLNTNGLNLYYENLVGDLDQIINKTVVPVPAAIWFLGSGFLAFIVAFRRKNIFCTYKI